MYSQNILHYKILCRLSTQIVVRTWIHAWPLLGTYASLMREEMRYRLLIDGSPTILRKIDLYNYLIILTSKFLTLAVLEKLLISCMNHTSADVW